MFCFYKCFCNQYAIVNVMSAATSQNRNTILKNVDGFDIVISSNKKLPKPIISNIAELIFKKLPHRDEKCFIMMSHDDKKYVNITLEQLRYITISLMKDFSKKGIKPGDTVFLTTLSVNSELLILLMFIALTAYGSRVLLPMFVETSQLRNWIQNTNCKTIILPEKEVSILDKKYDREKQIIREIKKAAKENEIITYDISEDFDIKTYLYHPIPKNFIKHNFETVEKAINTTNLKTESVIFTTSGTTGASKLVVYEQGAFIRSCTSWQEAGMFDRDKMGGRSYIDIIPHTISIRTYFNAIWVGYPVGIVISDWIKKNPSKVLPFLIKMKLEHVTLGPSEFKYIFDFISVFPELKQMVFSNLKKVVSTGAQYNKQTADTIKNCTGLYLHNAYGTSETQQVLSTLLYNEDEIIKFNRQTNESFLMPMGSPLVGISIGLKKFNDDSYQLFVKSPFGHKCIIDDATHQIIVPDEYFNTGDIVKIDENNRIYYSGRENRDFLKNGFGAKIPVSFMKKYYKRLYEQSEHIEYYPPELSYWSIGIASLIFIQDDTLPQGKVTDKRIINKYNKIIKKINSNLVSIVEPFEYEHRTITRFLIINNKIPKTVKGTVSKYRIDDQFKKEIKELTSSKEAGPGVKNIFSINDYLLKLTIKILPLKISYFRKMFLRLFLWKNRFSNK